MRSLFLPLAVALALIPSRSFPNATPEVDTTVRSIARPDSLGDRPAPWEAKADDVAPESMALPKEKSNAAYYGWGFVILAAAGMTLFLWRSSRNSD